MKQTTFYMILIGLFALQACGPSEREIKQVEYEKQKELNESKFYYPKSYDDWWRIYQPNLKGAEGWVTNDCENSKFNGKKGVVTNELLIHESWGSYKGSLTLKLIDTEELITINFKCFKPDFSIGEWLSK